MSFSPYVNRTNLCCQSHYLNMATSGGDPVALIYAGVIGSNVPWLDCPACNAFNMGHNGHGINLYGVIMTLMEN